MSLLRILFLIVLGAVCAFALYLFAYGPYKCMTAIQSVGGRTAAAHKAAGYQGVLQARANLAELETLDCFCESNIRLAMLKAANQWILGRTDEALATYRHALEIEPRTEIYYAIGTLLAEQGRFDEAVEPYATAVRFQPSRQEDVDRYSEELGRRVRERVASSGMTPR